MARTDSYGLHLSTVSDEAAQLYREGVTLLLSAWPGSAEKLEAAMRADPDFALAHAARARLYAITAQPGEARACVAVAEEKVARNGNEREVSHVGVLSLAVAGHSQKALEAALAHAERWPRDTIILSLPLGAFGLFAFSGMSDHNQARVDLCDRHAGQFDNDDWWFLTYRGWAHAEHSDVKLGRGLLERSIELRRANANGVHALAHAMFEAGAGDDADRLIMGWLPSYDFRGILYGHLAWHSALIALERGDPERALDIYDYKVRPAVSLGMPINVVSDAASLLWRLNAYGHAVPRERWQEIATYAGKAFPKAGHGFVDPHMVLIEAATGNDAALDQRLAALDEMVAKGALGAGVVVPTIGRAARAFAQGDFAGCARILEPVAAEVVRIGGSGAQREVIEDTLLVALMRSGETEKARALLDRRLHRRPSPRDARWRDQLVA
jgi:hypothetical protein